MTEFDAAAIVSAVTPNVTPEVFPTLDADANRALARAFAECRDPAIRSAMIQGNQRLVIKIATQYRNANVPLEELVNVGNVGLIIAIDRYDWQKDTTLSTWSAPWIHGEIRDFLRRQRHPVHVPEALLKKSGALARAEATLTQSLGRPPRLEELAGFLGWTIAEVGAVRRLQDLTLADSPAEERDALITSVPDDVDLLDQTETSEGLARLHLALDQLKPELRALVSAYFGLDRPEPLTYGAIGAGCGLTARQVKLRIEKALEQLRGELMPA